MLFNSYEFLLVFLPAAILIYWFADRSERWRAWVLILLSLVFYSYWDVRFLPLMVASMLRCRRWTDFAQLHPSSIQSCGWSYFSRVCRSLRCRCPTVLPPDDSSSARRVIESFPARRR